MSRAEIRAAADAPDALPPGAETGYHRRKNPDQTRAAILREAQALAAQSGLQAVTLQAVAVAAGVTKGGLLHHFPGKEALLNALRDALFTRYEAALERLIAQDPLPQGRFTRAYVTICLTGGDGPSPGEMAALWSDPGLRRQWYDWMEALETRHAQTDGARGLKLVRLAADGLWLAVSDGQDGSAWLPDLIAATKG